MPPTTQLYPQDGLRIHRSAWEAMMLNYLLLPALCAIFLIVIILIVAFVLIKKKSSSGSTCPEKSCHTIESFNEISDISIYDVINEISQKESKNAKKDHSFENVLESHQCFPIIKSRGMSSITSCLGLGNHNNQKQVVLKSIVTSPTNHAESSVMTPAVHSQFPVLISQIDSSSRRTTIINPQFENRVYETLERIKINRETTSSVNERELQIQKDGSQKNANLPIACGQSDDGKSGRSCTLQREQSGQLAETDSIISTGSIDSYDEHSSSVCECYKSKVRDCDDRQSPSSKLNKHMICKLSFYPIQKNSPSSHTNNVRNLYYVFKHGISNLRQEEKNSVLFQSNTSLYLHFSQSETSCEGDDQKKTNQVISLKPFKNSSLIQLFENKTSKMASDDSAIFSSLQNIPHPADIFERKRSSKSTSSSSSSKKCRLQKSESFSDTAYHHSRPQGYIRKYSLDAISGDSRHEKMDHKEMARILSKLGPLPPIPVSPFNARQIKGDNPENVSNLEDSTISRDMDSSTSLLPTASKLNEIVNLEHKHRNAVDQQRIDPHLKAPRTAGEAPLIHRKANRNQTEDHSSQIEAAEPHNEIQLTQNEVGINQIEADGGKKNAHGANHYFILEPKVNCQCCRTSEFYETYHNMCHQGNAIHLAPNHHFLDGHSLKQ